MRRFHTIITKYEYAPNAIYVLHWEQIKYFEIIVFLLQISGQYIFLFLWSDQVMYNCFIYT
ncbi:hypothetical protein BANRA_00158 [Escherichia coli]|nr:hypothetical protein BANRA_00158 [Escherichia coli]